MVGAWLVGPGVGLALGAGPIPGRGPSIPLFGALAPPTVTAASAARGTTTVPSPVAAAVVIPVTGDWTVGGATVDDRTILEAEIVNAPIGHDVARREIAGGRFHLRKTLGMFRPALPFRTSLERLRCGRGGPFPGRGRRGSRRTERNSVRLKAQSGDDVGPVARGSLGRRLLGLGTPRLDGSGGSRLRSGGGLCGGLVRRWTGAEAVGEGGPRIVCFRHGSDGFLDNGGGPKGAPWKRQG